MSRITNQITSSIDKQFLVFNSEFHDAIYSFIENKLTPVHGLAIVLSGSDIITANKDKLLLESCIDDDLIFELNKTNNLYLKHILISSLDNINNYLRQNKPACFRINCFLWRDIEVINWEKIIIEVKTNYVDIEEMEDIWDDLIRIIDQSYENYISQVDMEETEEEIQALNKTSIMIESLNDRT